MVAAGIGQSRLGLGLAVALVAVGLAGCGAPAVTIPKATPTPLPQATALAPGVTVPKSQLRTPSYTVSVSHPLPSGVSAATVVQDVQIDNLIENAAIERQNPSLLAYADTGDWLAAIQGEIGRNQAAGTTVVSLTDNVTSMKVGFQPDPNNARAQASVIVMGAEIQIDRLSSGQQVRHTTPFDVLRWVIWSPAIKRYLTCDTGSS